MPLVLLIGGARSGKSQLALELAKRCGRVVFVATAQARDEEMAARIANHRLERPDAWQTVEEPLQLLAALHEVGPKPCVVIECLSLWVANLLEAAGPAQIEEQARAAAELAGNRRGLTIAVTNEVGLGVVPTNALARTYRDLLGRTNAIWAETARDVLLVTAGRVLPLERAAPLLKQLFG